MDGQRKEINHPSRAFSANNTDEREGNWPKAADSRNGLFREQLPSCRWQYRLAFFERLTLPQYSGGVDTSTDKDHVLGENMTDDAVAAKVILPRGVDATTARK